MRKPYCIQTNRFKLYAPTFPTQHFNTKVKSLVLTIEAFQIFEAPIPQLDWLLTPITVRVIELPVIADYQIVTELLKTVSDQGRTVRQRVWGGGTIKA